MPQRCHHVFSIPVFDIEKGEKGKGKGERGQRTGVPSTWDLERTWIDQLEAKILSYRTKRADGYSFLVRQNKK